MSDARLQKAKRILANAEAIVARQRTRLAALQSEGDPMQIGQAAAALQTFEQVAACCRDRVDDLARHYGVQAPFFRVEASSAMGAWRALSEMDAEDALAAAMDLVDEGFDRIVLTNVETGEELHFRPPESKMN